jgi:oligopeptide/dipeptide ABC transporter ATP-binding protein
MLEEAYNTVLFTHPWALVPSGLVIALTVLAFNTLGDAMRDTVSGATTKGRHRHVRTQRGLTAVSLPAGAARTDAETEQESPALLEVRGLCIEFDAESGPARVVDEASFDVRRGQIVGLVGESGCGKTVSSLAVLRLLSSPPAQIVGGSIRFDGRELLEADFDEMRRIRGNEISMVFQDPLASLDPTFTVGSQLTEAMRLHDKKLGRSAARARAVELLKSVHIPDPERRLAAYPHQLSGGMRQRVMIAMALSSWPRLLIADEPTTALDVTIQAQIVELLQELRESMDLAVLFVTHDLALISELSDEIAVMYSGEVVEQAPTSQLFTRPRHPYTAALLAASPDARLASGVAIGRPALLTGHVPQAGQFPSGCRFHPRCPFVEDACRHEPIALEVIGRDRQCRCRRAHELALPGVGAPDAATIALEGTGGS